MNDVDLNFNEVLAICGAYLVEFIELLTDWEYG